MKNRRNACFGLNNKNKTFSVYISLQLHIYEDKIVLFLFSPVLIWLVSRESDVLREKGEEKYYNYIICLNGGMMTCEFLESLCCTYV